MLVFVRLAPLPTANISRMEALMSNAFFDALRAQEECRQRLAVTLPDYQQAVKTLLHVALTDTSGGRVAANLLLSLYDDATYPFPIADLGVLDLDLLEHALIAIRGRVLLAEDPHTIVTDGKKLFEQLVQRWPQLQAQQRYGQ